MMRQLVPDFILKQFARGQYTGQLTAVCLFVDTSGFTPLTNALMTQGSLGAEQIAAALAAVFTPLGQIISQQGGFIAGFAGDAFKAVFPLDADNVCHRAIVAAWQIRHHMAAADSLQTPVGTFDIAVKVTVAAGRLDWGIWQGDSPQASQNSVYYFAGEALSRCLAADSYAQPGDVVLTEAVFQQIAKEGITGRQVGDYWRLTAVSPTLIHSCPAYPLPETAIPQPHLTHFFSPDLIYLSTLGEFRQVTSVFINLQSLTGDETLPRTLFRLLHQYGGYLCRLGRVGDKDAGGSLLLFWGAPQSHENDVERALHFILNLQAATSVPLKAGVTTGLAFTGFVGSPLAEEYTCHSSTVNLAARQMVMADWQEIWLDEATARPVQTAFVLAEGGTFHFKGFAEPRPIFLLQGVRATAVTPFYRGRLIGRSQELAQLQTAVQPLLKDRQGRFVTIVGEAGMGKSRLLHEFLTTGQGVGHCRLFTCQTDEILRQSLNPFRYGLRQYFEQSPTAAETINLARFQEILAELVAATADPQLQAQLRRTRSFLAALVDLHWPDSLYAQLEPKLRFENTLIALKTFFKAESLRQPLIIVLEDGHWLDEDSRLLLDSFLQDGATLPFLLLITTRPQPAATTMNTSAPHTTIELTSLTRERVQVMATEVLGGAVAGKLTALLTERSEGNPLFVEQLLLYLRDEGILQLNGRWSLSQTDTLSLPMDVRSLLVARLDRLPVAVRQLMQTAAVLGREFALPVLRHMVDKDVALMQGMETAVAAGICTPINENRYQFRHVLLREAAYEMQLHGQRHHLHHQAALSLESVYAPVLTPHYADLAHHYQQANIIEQAIHYLQLAGDAAREAYQNQAASHYYGRALNLLPDQALLRRYELLLAHEAMCGLLGQREAQQQDLQSLAQIADELANAAKQSQVALRQALFYEDTGDYAASITAARQAINRAQQTNQPQPIASAHMAWGRALTRQGNHELAREQITLALNLAQQTDDLRLIGDCLRSLASIFGSSGRFRQAQIHYQRARETYSRAHYRWGEAACSYNLGNNSGVLGEPGQARTYYERALSLFREIGERRGVAWTLTALGNWHRWQATTARHYLEQAQAIFHEINDRYGVGWVLRSLGFVAQIHGHDDEALTYQAQCLPIFQQIGAQEQETIAYLDRGYSYASVGEWDKARQAYQSAQQILQTADLVIRQIVPIAGLARLALAEGKLEEALSHTEKVWAYIGADGKLPIQDALWIQWTCYKVWQVGGDEARAGLFRQKATDELAQQAAQLPDDGTRQAFLQNVPLHRRISTLD